MINYIIMGLLLFFLAMSVIWNAKKCVDSNHFFDIENTKAMRGFWCLVIILVHVPAAYQNRIQDMIGSFAYIGVTFFFMTSAYGLTLTNERKPETLRIFWRKRLPKLLITNWVVNFLFYFVYLFVFDNKMSIRALFGVNGWVEWIIGCYFIFWIMQLLFRKSSKSGYIACMMVIVICSVSIYFLGKFGFISGTTWTSECYGFIWGILLLLLREQFIKILEKKWIKNVLLSCVIAFVLGVAYLKFKPVPFWGDYILKVLLGISITVFILICNIRVKIGNKISLMLGAISYEVYLIHGNVFGILSRLFEKLESGYFILLSIVLTILCAWIVHTVSKYMILAVQEILLRQTA